MTVDPGAAADFTAPEYLTAALKAVKEDLARVPDTGVSYGALRYLTHVEFDTPSSLCDKLMAAGFSRVTAHGAMFAPLRVLHKASPRLGAAVSRLTMPHETWLSD